MSREWLNRAIRFHLEGTAEWKQVAPERVCLSKRRGGKKVTYELSEPRPFQLLTAALHVITDILQANCLQASTDSTVLVSDTGF